MEINLQIIGKDLENLQINENKKKIFVKKARIQNLIYHQHIFQ
jgi:hypothetical protein